MTRVLALDDDTMLDLEASTRANTVHCSGPLTPSTVYILVDHFRPSFIVTADWSLAIFYLNACLCSLRIRPDETCCHLALRISRKTDGDVRAARQRRLQRLVHASRRCKDNDRPLKKRRYMFERTTCA